MHKHGKEIAVLDVSCILLTKSTQASDSAYDTKDCHKLLKRKGSKPNISPGEMLVTGRGHPRNVAEKALKNNALKQRKKDNDYHQRSLS
jgi:hypothetical protein